MPVEPSAAELGPVAARAYLRIAAAWHLDPTERARLLGCDVNEYDRFLAVPGQAEEQILRRVRLVLGVHEALRSIFSSEAQADRWLRGPNRASLFGGHTPMEAMLSGEAELTQVRDYVVSAAMGPI